MDRVESEWTVGRDRFQRLAELGRGSMGVVYRVHDHELGIEVALKTFAAREPDALYRLKQEFRSIADVVHPNLVELHELIVDDRDAFFTMELVRGASFTEYARGPSTTVDAGRVLDIVPQLLEGLAAVHDAGKLHRDIKPTNILVSDRGRAVILDFGLATALGLDTRHHDADASVSGTLVYMSPEQLLGHPPHPADDWYSLGVMLFEVITGELPAPAAYLLDGARRQKRIDTLLALAPARGIPAALTAIVYALLDRDPHRRGSADQLLQRLGLPGRGRGRNAVLPADSDAPFVGRTAELRQLQAAFTAARNGAARVAAIRGPSGIGKSELVRQFLRDIHRQCAETIVLRGRCHLQEVVPYNALDGIVDALSRVLISLPAVDLARIVPRHAMALRQLFPVLERVPDLVASDDMPVAIDGVAARRVAFAAFCELLQNIAREQPLVLWIDDVQWGDADSAALLGQLIQQASTTSLLVILTYRDDAQVPFVDALHAARPHPTTFAAPLELPPLNGAETQTLATRLLSASSLPSQQLQHLLSECAGSPFLLGELLRGLAEPAGDTALDRGLTDVLERRQRDLPPAAHELLAFVATAARPLERSLALQVAGLGERGRPLVSALTKACLLRSSMVDGQLAIEPYHDRLREALRQQLSPDVEVRCHATLADTYEARGAYDPELLLLHSLGAGRRERAAHWAVEGAARADAALAFARAAQLYEQALELMPGSDGRWEVRAKLGHALANSGRSRQAAEALDEAARELEQSSSQRQEIVDLRGAAAAQYLRAGAYTEGTRTARAALAAIGLELPKTPGAAAALALRERLRLLSRGTGFEMRVHPTRPARLDTLWGVAITLGAQDQTLGDAVAVRHCLEALDSGHPLHIVRALGFEVAKASQLGGTLMRRRCARLLAQMRTVVDESGEEGRAFEHMVCGVVAYQNAAWAEAYTHLRDAIAIQRRSVVGSHWGISSAQNFKLSALAHMGDLRRLAPELEEAIQEASERGDVHAAVAYHGGPITLHWLAQDRNDLARQHDATAQAMWPTTDVALVAHYVYLIAAVTIELYEGNGWAAWQRITEWWPRLRRGLFLLMESPRVELLQLRGRAALAAAQSSADEPQVDLERAWPRKRLLRDAEQCARALARNHRVRSAQPLAHLLAASVAHARGVEAAELYHRAWQECTAVDMNLHATAARARFAELTPGSRREHGDAVSRWLDEQQVRNPTALVQTFCPVATDTPLRRTLLGSGPSSPSS